MLSTFDRASHARHYFDSLLNQSSYQAEYQMQEQTTLCYRAGPGGDVRGRIRVPGDKSISHRAIMLGAWRKVSRRSRAFSKVKTVWLPCRHSARWVLPLRGRTRARDDSRGRAAWPAAPSGPLYVGNAGTAMRLFAGLLAGQAFDTELTGDVSLTKRPMGRVADRCARWAR